MSLNRFVRFLDFCFWPWNIDFASLLVFAMQVFENFKDEDSGRQVRPGDEWKKHCAIMRDTYGKSSNYRPWSSQPGITMRGVPDNARQREVIEIAWIDRLERARKEGLDPMQARVDYYVDFTQAAQRRPWGSAKTLQQGQLALQRAFVGQDGSTLVSRSQLDGELFCNR